ncbi:ATP-dependent protease [Salinivibrio kushneri]|uniref:endopeptidase La n=2 Tax=Salinivibrio kushneri TaxID=1908198 RepID=A0AB36JUI9_9GAMM|nr:ATP-binding protein [Salinivibrio kushneri]OOE38598.1 ATP-dependent protease [Salinivibrio kushneri]QCP02361.1 ATP-dependent protease [Salinivibrio kushneri]
MAITPLKSDRLYRESSLKHSDITSTKHLAPLDEIVGQDRARHAVEFAMSIKEKGYNIYAIGQNGLGKRTMMMRYLNQHWQSESPVYDWCYVANFQEARAPEVLKLPAGKGSELKKHIEQLMGKLANALPMAFDNEMYYQRAETLKNQLTERQQSVLQGLSDTAEKNSVSLTITPQGDYQFVALNGEEPHTEETFDALSQDEQMAFGKVIDKLETELRGIVRQLGEWESEYAEKQKALDEDIAQDVIATQMAPLKKQFADLPDILAFLDAMQADMLEHLDIFLEDSEEQAALAYAALDKKLPRRYQVNVLVSQNDAQAPIVVEDSPSYHNLFGYVENATFKGTVFTDFSLIRSGSLHRANGGVLLMDAIKVLEKPYVWDGIKRALSSRQLSVSALEREVTLSGTVSLDPAPIPLDVKIILFGDYQTYQLLQRYDAEFIELFRVTADFEDDMPRTESTEQQYAKFISSIIHDSHLLHCSRSAIARIIEHSARQAEDQNRLSLHSADIANLLRESNYWANHANANSIGALHVEKALASRNMRVSRLRDSMMQNVENGVTLINTHGTALGQINGLSVLSTSDYSFGLPNRITATTAFGEGEVLDIERSVKLGGRIHSKGVMILSAYLANLLGKTDTIPLKTHLTFEQSYGGVDGDSASMAEFCAIFSAITDVPLRQDIAITGSMNQFGEAQPIGGVNEKIEGFFDVCTLKGPSSTQGVIIPTANVQNLMLRKDVVLAVEKGEFHVYAVSHVSDALALLAGQAAGFGPDSDNGSGLLAIAIDKLNQQRAAHQPQK